MKNKKALLMIVALITSIFLWIYIDSRGTTGATTSIHNIEIEFHGEQESLFTKNLMISKTGSQMINLELQGPRAVISKLNRNNVQVIVDLSEISSSGHHELNYKIFYPDSVPSSSVIVKSASVYSVSVDVVAMTHRSVPIKGIFKGSIADGYSAQEFEFNPGTIDVYAQQEDIQVLSHAQVVLEHENANTSITSLLPVELIDMEGKPLDISRYRLSTDLIITTLPIKTIVTLPLTVSFIEGAGSSIKNLSYVITPKQITIQGDSSSVSSLTSISLGSIDLHTLTSDNNTLQFTIPIPSDATCITGEREATVTIEFFGMDYTSLDVKDISVINIPSGYNALILNKSIRISLRGPQADIANIRPENVRLVADLKNISEGKGIFDVPVTVFIDGYPEIGAISDYEISVQITR